jgi:anti-anti-sigma factor
MGQMIEKRELKTGDTLIEARSNLLGDAVEEFRTALHEAIAAPGHLILLDLAKVQAMSSRAIGVLMLARKMALAEGRTIRFDKCNPKLAKTLLALRFDTIFDMSCTE